MKERRDNIESSQKATKNNSPIIIMPHSNSFQCDLPRTILEMNKVPEHCTQINVELKKARNVNCLTPNLLVQIPSTLDDRSSLAGGNLRGEMHPKYSESRAGGENKIINITSQRLSGGLRVVGEASTVYKTRRSSNNLSMIINRRFSEIDLKNLRD